MFLNSEWELGMNVFQSQLHDISQTIATERGYLYYFSRFFVTYVLWSHEEYTLTLSGLYYQLLSLNDTFGHFTVIIGLCTRASFWRHSCQFATPAG